MKTRIRPGIFKGVAVGALAAAAFLATAVVAGAVRPAPGTVDTQGQFEFSDVQGYTAAGSGTACGAYAQGATFGVNVNVFNNGAETDQAFNLQLWKMTDLNGATCYTEAQLETMVQNNVMAAQAEVVNTDTTASHFAAGKPLPAQAGSSQRVSASAAIPGSCEYLQFDVALSGSGPLSPGSGHVVPPVSGFIHVGGCQSSGTGGVTTSTTPVPRSSGTSAAAAGTLASTGGGPASLAPYLAILLFGAALVLSGGLLLRRPRDGT